uniref:Hes family bHLH transcription factor 6 n=1 Tax=Anser cygnoides TaxID=8845 RepID=A0A8B9DTR1_ANSCY
MGPALARRIKGGEQRSGGEHLSLSSGTSPDAFIWCRLSGELQLPTVSGVKLPHKAARGLGTAGLGGPGRAGGVPAAGPGPGQHQGAGPRQRRPRGVLPEGDRRAPAPRASAAALENAEVLELTVRRVQAVLERRSLEGGRLHREASERFAAGYIQCMHEVHTFVSSCPGIDATTAAELLNHLLESMPLNEGGFQDLIADVLAEPSLGPWPGGEARGPAAEASPGLVLPASAPSPSPSEETCSDSDEAEAELGQTSADGLDASRTRSVPSPSLPKSMWRPW